MKRCGWLRLLAAWVLALCLPAWAPGAAAGEVCAPGPLSAMPAMTVMAARADADRDIAIDQPPAQGWETVTLPDTWTRRWPGHTGTVWYRIDWEHACTDTDTGTSNTPPLALGVNSITMAGAVYLNGQLLWRDASLVDPLSHGWNMPHWWLLPAAALRPGVNSIHFRVTGPAELAPGLGRVRLGPAAQIETEYERRQWSHRTLWLLAATLSSTIGMIFGVVWLLRRQERAFGWYALASLCWAAFLATLLLPQAWLLPGLEDSAFNSSLAMSRLNLSIMVLYVLCFCMFTFRFGAQALARTERILQLGAAVGVATAVLVPRSGLEATSKVMVLGCVLVFMGNCLQFQWHAWRTRERTHRLLALCYAVFLAVAVHDVLLVVLGLHDFQPWGMLSSLVATCLMAWLLSTRLVTSLRQVERANLGLEARVAEARAELAQVLERDHARALEHTRLQERLQLAHDLHDGLGGNLVRSIALVEQAERKHQPLAGQRVLSLLKLLRDDLRQMIDHGSSTGATVPATPVLWMAPLRRRFTRLFDELGMEWEWHIAPQWRSPQEQPSALQCLHLTRIAEEALTNAIKHSRARRIRVSCTQPEPWILVMRIEDDGVGFEVAQQNADMARQDGEAIGLGVGMRSMSARIDRLGGTLQLTSAPGQGTAICVTLTLQ